MNRIISVHEISNAYSEPEYNYISKVSETALYEIGNYV